MLNIIIVWAAIYRFWDLLDLLETGQPSQLASKPQLLCSDICFASMAPVVLSVHKDGSENSH